MLYSHSSHKGHTDYSFSFNPLAVLTSHSPDLLLPSRAAEVRLYVPLRLQELAHLRSAYEGLLGRRKEL